MRRNMHTIRNSIWNRRKPRPTPTKIGKPKGQQVDLLGNKDSQTQVAPPALPVNFSISNAAAKGRSKDRHLDAFEKAQENM